MALDIFNRRYRLTVGRPGQPSRSWDELRIKHEVTHTKKRSANEGIFTIFNLSEESRNYLAQDMTIQYEAGFSGDWGRIFRGDIKTIKTSNEGPDVVTVIRAGDGHNAIKTSTIQATIRSNANATDISKELSRALGGVEVGDGFASVLRDIGSQFGGISLDGSVADELDSLLTVNGFNWSIQDNTLQVLAEDSHLPNQAIVLTGNNSQAPAPLDDGFEFTTPLLHWVRPGRLIDAQYSKVKGLFVVKSHKSTGDTHGQDWKSVIETRAKK